MKGLVWAHTLSLTPGENLRHPIELAHDALLAASDADRVVEHGVLGVVRVGLIVGFCLVQTQNVVYQFLLLGAGLAGWQGAGGGRGRHGGWSWSR